jgi:predicted branched-subunit amino acid permease
MYAAALLSTLFWATGCAIGITAGSLLPQHMVTALSMSLYGMFLAVFIPPARRDRNVLLAVIASFTLSGICAVAPVISQWSSGMRTVLLTVVISAVAAWLKPIKSDDNGAA